MTDIKDALLKTFNNSDLVTVLESARIALSDGFIFDGLALKMDLSDKAMLELRDKLEKLLGYE